MFKAIKTIRFEYIICIILPLLLFVGALLVPSYSSFKMNLFRAVLISSSMLLFVLSIRQVQKSSLFDNISYIFGRTTDDLILLLQDNSNIRVSKNEWPMARFIMRLYLQSLSKRYCTNNVTDFIELLKFDGNQFFLITFFSFLKKYFDNTYFENIKMRYPGSHKKTPFRRSFDKLYFNAADKLYAYNLIFGFVAENAKKNLEDEYLEFIQL